MRPRNSVPGPSGPGRSVPSAMLRPRFADRYDRVHLLKDGNGVATYLALDADSGARVVLKTFDLATVAPGMQARFRHETRVLRELAGAGVGALLDAGRTDTHLYLVQPYVPGHSLEEVLADGALPVPAVLSVGAAVATALDVAHGAGVHHRDVKPANIMVNGRRPDGSFETVTLIDFGFARSPWLDEAIRDDLVGTVRYLSPESAGLLASPPDERSDLYALGVVLFECATGHPPFDGRSVGDLMRQHLSTPVPDLRTLVHDVPRALDAVVSRLLRKDPAERYQTAAAVATDLDQIIQAAAAGQREPAVVIGRRDRRGTLTDPAFVGRESELAALGSFAAGLCAGRGGLLLLDADSGGGKTRLLGELTATATAAGVHVLHGQGVAFGGQRPFTLLQGVAAGLVDLFAPDPDRCAQLAADLDDAAPAVVRALPALSDLLGVRPQPDAAPEEFGELRSLAGLCRLLDVVADADRPVLLVLDDCQWADALTIRLLAELFAESRDAPRHLGVIAAFRSEEVGAEHALRALPAAEVMHLGPLPRRSVALLAESMAGALPESAIDTIARLADGNPFMAAAVLRGLVEADALVPSPSGWSFDAGQLPEAQTARRSAGILVRRLELLAAPALDLLSVGAVLGKTFDLKTAAEIADAPGDPARVLEDARRRRLIWMSEDGCSCTFFHDKIRESLLDRLAADIRRTLHGRAADALAARHRGPDEDVVFDLAYHLDAAGRRADALPYAIAAAELARSRYALDVAATYYRMAAAAAGPGDRDIARSIAEGLGDVLTLQGVYDQAKQQFTAARVMVTDPLEAAALDGKLGELAFKQADIAAAKARLEGALALLGRRVPSRRIRPVFLLWELIVQTVHSLLPVLIRRRDPAQQHGDFLAMRLYSRLAYLYWFHSGRVACAWAHLREMNLAERYPPSPELGQAWSEHAPVMTMVPWYRRGVRYAQRSLEIRQSLGDVWGQGQSLNFAGVVLYAASEYPRARQACEQANRLLLRTGDQWEVNTGSWTLALCHYRMGDLRACVDLARKTYESGLAIGDKTAAGIALSIWARAVEGRLPPELVQAQLVNAGEDAQTTADLHLADALVRRAAGDLAGAVECVDRGIRVIEAAGLRQEYIVPVYAWHATVARELSESTDPYQPRRRRKRLRQAAASARRARRWGRAYRNNAAHALRESALVAALRGRRRASRRWLAASCAVADRHGERYEAALSREALARLQRETAEALAEARAAVQGFDPLGRTRPDEDATPALSIFDRFSTLLEFGRSIAAAASPRALEAAVRDSAVALLRPERYHLIPVTSLAGDTLVTQSGVDVVGISRTLLTAAIRTGRPVVTLDESPATTESLVLSGVRSALAAPIFVHGDPLACLYVSHRHVGELFGEEEKQLAELITTLAGAGYEHLAGSETRSRALAQSSTDVITLVDPDGVITYQSAAVQRVFDLPADGFVGRPLTDWVHPEDVEACRFVLAAARDGEAAPRVECRLQHADGTYRFTESVVTNLLDEPTVGALVLNTRDITDRKITADQLRVVEERERIARDLHDVVIQRLFAVGLGLDALSSRLTGPPAEQVTHATDELHHTIRDIRGAIFSLRSDEPTRPLHERLAAVFSRAEQSLGFAPEVDLRGPIDGVPEEVHLHLLATLTEALSNVARHAAAKRVWVTIRAGVDELTAVIADDGRGLPPDRQESGLANLRRRAEIAGGTMTTSSGPEGTGLVLTWHVPLRAAS
jgi:PAS domain S-box-containing protein